MTAREIVPHMPLYKQRALRAAFNRGEALSATELIEIGARRPITERVIRECGCSPEGCIESDHAPGSFYPCNNCNPEWCRIFGPTSQEIR